MEIINFGIIGTGWITEAFLKATKKVEGLNLTCIYSRTKEKAQEFTKKISPLFDEKEFNIFTNLDEMAKSDKLDAVYIASPNALHYEQSRLFLANGKHVICEKPIATSGDMAKDLFALAEKNKLIFMEAIMALHMPQWQLLLDYLPKLGRISQAHFSYCQLSSKYPALLRGELPNIFNPKMKTGCIMDIGIYCLYPTLALFSQPTAIKSSAKLLENGIDLCGSSIFSYEGTKFDGMIVDLSYSKIGDGYAPSQIIGDKGSITIDKLSHLDGIRYYNEYKQATLLHKNHDDFLPMQFEAESFYKYITENTHQSQYSRLSALACDTAKTLALMRQKSGVAF